MSNDNEHLVSDSKGEETPDVAQPENIEYQQKEA